MGRVRQRGKFDAVNSSLKPVVRNWGRQRKEERQRKGDVKEIRKQSRPSEKKE